VQEREQEGKRRKSSEKEEEQEEEEGSGGSEREEDFLGKKEIQRRKSDSSLGMSADEEYLVGFEDEEEEAFEIDDDEDGDPSTSWIDDDPEDFSHYESIYTVLSEEETFRECKKMIEEVREVCSVPACTAAALLQQFKWNPENVINSWLEDPDRTLKKCGVGGQDEKKKKEKRSVGAVSDLIVKVDPGFLQCLVCYDVVKEEEVFSLGCNHPYCKDCWLNYLTLSVQDGPGCVQTHCMFPDCTELVHDEIFRKIVPPKVFDRYMYFFYRSFVEKTDKMKWCPAPACTSAIRTEKKITAVTCSCGFSFCFKCADFEIGDHMPATCEMVEKWLEKAVDESENVKWMLVNTKKCPKCSTPIEKNGGCMHMTCGKNVGGCGYDFCWLCRGPWKDHGSHTGGYYSCNKFEKSKEKEEDDKVQNAKTELERYMFHFHRYDSHRSARRIASKQLQQAEAKGLKMQERFNLRASDTTFLVEATKQLLKNYRALEFSYIYGFYFDKGEKERSLFLYLQEDLEKHTGALSGLYERSPDTISDYENFCQWRETVSNYTSVIKKFLDHFVEGVSQGLTS